jgi:hypothetical protein
MSHSDYFSKVQIDGEDVTIITTKVSAKVARKGAVNFPPSSTATDDDYRSIGYWPHVGTKPAYTNTQRISEPVYTPNADNSTIVVTWVVTDFTLAERKAALKASVTARRWEVETGGIVLSGATIATDPATQAKLSGALQLVQDDDTRVLDWKAESGWIQIDADTVTAIVRAVGLHVQSCFSREKDLHTEIDDAEDADDLALINTTTGAINGVGSWPANGA